jgi:predicted ABC-type ATPase
MLETKNFEAASKVHEESSKLSKDIIKNAVSRKFDTVIDAVGDGSYQSVVDKVQMQRDAGKNVIAHYVTTDVQTSLNRAHERAISSGRYVPPDYNKEMHKEISTIFPKLAANNVFNELHLYDNNGSTPKLIYSKANGKETIYDKISYKKFLDKSKG